MMPNRTRARGFAAVLVVGMMMVVAVALPACGAKRGDPSAAPWDQYIQAMDDALARGDFYAADLARRTAYLMALGSRRWDAMAAVGDAYVRFVAVPGASPTLRPEARRIYRSALLRAHQQGSIEGVLRVSEAFAALGDKEEAREGLTMAAAMAAASHESYDAARAEALTDRLDNQASSHEESARDLGAPAASAVTWTR
jgi:hypothetical protein